jgi:hypothetical protein
MDPNSMSPRDLLIYGVLINTAVGLVLGLVPLISGFVKRKVKYGILGFVLSAIGGALLGVVLAIPASAIFTWLVFRDPRVADAAVVLNDDGPVGPNGR